MKKLENLGKKLSKDEQKKIIGGIVIQLPTVHGLVGWRLDPSGQCWGDFVNYAYWTTGYGGGVGEPFLCNKKVDSAMCTEGSIDPCPFGCS